MIALASASTFAFLYWRQNACHTVQSYRACLLDRSGSVTQQQRGFEAIIKQGLDEPGIHKGATITAMATGDDSTANEPILIGKYEIPVSNRALEGKQGQSVRLDKVFSELRDKAGRLKPTQSSPIYQGVIRAVESLRANGCTENSNCYLFIKTDGEELIEPNIRQALRGKISKEKFPKPIDNRGIKVLFCGLSETLGNKNEAGVSYALRYASRLDRRRDVWTALFSNPEIVSFEPFCKACESTEE
jgi:hypothetical protein